MNQSASPSFSRVGDQLRMLAAIAEQVDRLEAENRSLSDDRTRLAGALAAAEARLGQVTEERDRLSQALAAAQQELALANDREAAWRGEAARVAGALRELADRLNAAPVGDAEAPRRHEEVAEQRAEVSRVAVESLGATEEATPAATEEPVGPVSEAVSGEASALEATEAPPSPPPSETYELAAAPFSSFSTLIAFQKAVAGLPGVEDVRTKSFLNGALVLSLRYRGPDPLTVSLSRLPGFHAERVSAVGNRIEFVVASESSPR